MSNLTGPRQVILVTYRGRYLGQEKDGVMSAAWHMPVSKEPFLYAIAIKKTSFCHQLIDQSDAFAVNFMSDSYLEAIKFCGTTSSKHVDKFKQTNLTKEESEKIDCPKIKESLGFLECKVINKIPTGDHTIFIGHVLNHEFKQEKPRIFHITGDKFAQMR